MISKLSEFTNLCLSGDIPDIICPVFFGATLCALSKKNGGIRPIAVGYTLRRLVAKTACRLLCDRVVSKLAPTQLGFGVQHGSEAAAHAARTCLQDLVPGKAILKIDFSNAFNSLRRDVIQLYYSQYRMSYRKCIRLLLVRVVPSFWSIQHSFKRGRATRRSFRPVAVLHCIALLRCPSSNV